MRLDALQSEFLRGVFDVKHDAVAAAIAQDHLTPQKRLDIYRNNVFSNFRGALEAVYPAILSLVGEEFFDHAARQFSKRYPSLSGDIHHFGREFPEFLADFPGASGYPYLRDTARLEWLVHEVFHEADHARFDLRKLQDIAPTEYQSLKFKLNPAARLIRSDFPIRRIWQVNQPDYQGEIQVDLTQGGECLLVIRRNFAVEIEPLTPADFALLSAFAAGEDFGAAIEKALTATPDWDAGAALQRHVLNQVLVDLL